MDTSSAIPAGEENEHQRHERFLRFWQTIPLVSPARTLNSVRLWDQSRQQWRRSTPEEIIRQHVFRCLEEIFEVPRLYISTEIALRHFVRNRYPIRERADILVLDKTLHPALLVECKAPSIPVNWAVMQQALTYLRHIPVYLLWLTNGKHHWMAQRVSPRTWQPIPFLPVWRNWYPPEFLQNQRFRTRRFPR